MGNGKDLPLAAKARELLIYTRRRTKPVNTDVDARDVSKLLHRIAELDDLDKAREVCKTTAYALKRHSKEGFSKVSYRDFGQDMRDISKAILRGIYAANNVPFQLEPERRIAEIDAVLNNAALLLDYISICQELEIIGVKTAGTWSSKVVDVKRMAASWRNNSAQRAQAIQAQRQAERDECVAFVVLSAVEEALKRARKNK